jgi:hypothetical protein
MAFFASPLPTSTLSVAFGHQIHGLLPTVEKPFALFERDSKAVIVVLVTVQLQRSLCCLAMRQDLPIVRYPNSFATAD